MFHGNSEEKLCKEQSRQLLDVSSLVDLKAELFKKQEALKNARLNVTDESSKRRPIKLKGDSIKKIQKQPSRIVPTSEEDENDLSLKNSRLALETKSRLYEQIVSKQINIGDTEEENYLVNFHKKVIDNDRSCKRTVESNHTLNYINHPNKSASLQESEKSIHDNKESGNLNEENSTKNEYTHYQNVHFNEVRDHGVGYFAFSKDEVQRKEQLDSLNALHNQTNKRRKCYNDKLERKTLSLQSRLTKICQRRNIDRNIISNYVPEKDITNLNLATAEGIPEDVSSIPLPELEPVEEKPVEVRPWDIGKQFGDTSSNVKKWAKAGAEEWIENKRSERLQEFQPPEQYHSYS